jgi:putative transposase
MFNRLEATTACAAWWNSRKVEVMAKKKRHTEAEIVAKLQQADTLAAQGRTQSEIAETLGISVMTFHRWRKAHPQRSGAATTYTPTMPVAAGGRQNRVTTLETENARLRKLVADLLLEKMRLEEELQYRSRPLKRNG